MDMILIFTDIENYLIEKEKRVGEMRVLAKSSWEGTPPFKGRTEPLQTMASLLQKELKLIRALRSFFKGEDTDAVPWERAWPDRFLTEVHMLISYASPKEIQTYLSDQMKLRRYARGALVRLWATLQRCGGLHGGGVGSPEGRVARWVMGSMNKVVLAPGYESAPEIRSLFFKNARAYVDDFRGREGRDDVFAEILVKMLKHDPNQGKERSFRKVCRIVLEKVV